MRPNCQSLFFLGDNLHEMSKPVFSEKIRNMYFKMSYAEILTSMPSIIF